MASIRRFYLLASVTLLVLTSVVFASADEEDVNEDEGKKLYIDHINN